MNDDERKRLVKDLATVRFFINLTIAGGVHPSGAPQALTRIAAALGFPPCSHSGQTLDERCDICDPGEP
jgi:hypothetical protein